MLKSPQIRIPAVIAAIFLFIGNIAAQETIINGLVLDYYHKQPLPYASVLLKNSQIGTTTDIDGKFTITTKDLSHEKLVISYLGYDTRTVQFTPGIKQRATIELKPDDKVLNEVDVVGAKRVRKDTAAHTLFRNVVRNKPLNAPQEYDNYAYTVYSKTVFGLYDLNDKFPERVVVRKVPFVFDNIDTIPESGIIIVPGLIKESYKHILYRKQPQKTKEYLFADNFSGVDNHSISDLVEFNYEDIDIYENTVNVNGKPIMSPFANNALLNYKYFLTDTQNIDGYHCYKLQFTGRSSKDNAFSGHAWIHDTTYAIKDIYITLLPQANINFISLFELEQGFTRIEGKYWFKDRESFQTNFNLLKKAGRQSFMAKKESWRQNILVNYDAIDTLVNGEPRIVVDGARDQPEEFWEKIRMQELSPQEANVYPTVDSVFEVRVVKFLKWFMEALQSRYFGAGPFEIGQYDQMYSYNALEGSRVKVGMRTSTNLSERFLLGGFGAYGFKDEAWKYGASFRVHLKRRNELWHMLGADYRYDYSFVGDRDRNDVHDNILNVLLRSDPIDNIFLTRKASAFYERDWMPGLTTKLDFSQTKYLSVPGKFNFDLESGAGDAGTGFTSTEFGMEFTWGKGTRYYESSSDFDRSPITNTKPRLTLSYRTGIKGFLKGDVGYHKLELRMNQKLLSPIGYTKYTVYGGKFFGKVPYPLLEMHRGNESVYFEDKSFNVMNDFEFVGDGYASFWLEHHFDGFIMNKIPGIKFLQLRTLFYYKYLFSWLNEDNEDVIPLLEGMSGLDGHYHEIGFGLENIFKLFRLDAIWRLTQKGKPEVQKWGIRFLISPQF